MTASGLAEVFRRRKSRRKKVIMSGFDGDFSEESNNVSAPKKRDRSPEKLRNAFKNDGSFLQIFQLLHQEINLESIPLPTGEAPSPPPVTVSTVSTPLTSASQLMPMTSPSPPSVDSGGKITKKKSLLNFVGKLRGGKVLPTGEVKKLKRLDHVKEGIPKNTFSQYMKEVQKYKEVCCEEEKKTRALLK